MAAVKKYRVEQSVDAWSQNARPRLIDCKKIAGIDPLLDVLSKVHAELYEFFDICGKITPIKIGNTPLVITVLSRNGRLTCIGNCDAWIATRAMYGLDKKMWCLVLYWQDGNKDIVNEIVQAEIIMTLARLRTRRTGPLIRNLVESLDESGYSFVTNGRMSKRAILDKFRMSYRAYMQSKNKKASAPEAAEPGVDIKTPVKKREEMNRDKS